MHDINPAVKLYSGSIGRIMRDTRSIQGKWEEGTQDKVIRPVQQERYLETICSKIAVQFYHSWSPPMIQASSHYSLFTWQVLHFKLKHN